MCAQRRLSLNAPLAHAMCCGLLLFALTGCSGARQTSNDRLARPDVEAVPRRPGAVAWSPDGAKLAYIDTSSLVILDLQSGRAAKVPDVAPTFIDWAPARALVVVDGSSDSARVARLDPETGRLEGVAAAPDRATAVRWLEADKSMMVVSATHRTLKIGTVADASLTRVDHHGATTLLTWSMVLPTIRPDPDFTSGWSYTGPRPVTGGVLVPTFRAPPQLDHSLRFLELDPATGGTARRLRIEGRHRYTAAGSWSPDGSRLALTDASGQLAVYHMSGDELVLPVPSPGDPNPERTIRGQFPSWNPQGSQIHLGGWLLTPSGRPIRSVQTDAADALGVWSPDGTRLALINDGQLTVWGGIVPIWMAPDRALDAAQLETQDRLRLLRSLRVDRLIDDKEYQMRCQRLLEKLGPAGPKP